MIKVYTPKLTRQEFASSIPEFLFLFCQLCLYIPMVYYYNFMVEVLYVPFLFMIVLGLKRLIKKKIVKIIIETCEKVIAAMILYLIINRFLNIVNSPQENFISANLVWFLFLFTFISTWVVTSLRNSPKYRDTINWYMGEKLINLFPDYTSSFQYKDLPFKSVAIENNEIDMLRSLIVLNRRITIFLIIFFATVFLLFNVIIMVKPTLEVVLYHGIVVTSGLCLISYITIRSSQFKKDIKQGVKFKLRIIVEDKYLLRIKRSENRSDDIHINYITINGKDVKVTERVFNFINTGDTLLMEILPASGILMEYKSEKSTNPNNKQLKTTDIDKIRDNVEITKIRNKVKNQTGFVLIFLFLGYTIFFALMIINDDDNTLGEPENIGVVDFFIFFIFFQLYCIINHYAKKKEFDDQGDKVGA